MPGAWLNQAVSSEQILPC